MTLETALLAALSAVTTALCWSVKALYERLTKAESTVEALRVEMEKLERENGEQAARVKMYERCSRDGCPFTSTRTATS